MGLKISKNLMEAMERERKKEEQTDKKEVFVLPDNPTADEIKKYLNSITSGIRYDNIYEFGEGIINAGKIIVSLKEIQRMVDEGYNIISTEYHNPFMIEVEYQEIIKKGRGR